MYAFRRYVQSNPGDEVQAGKVPVLAAKIPLLRAVPEYRIGFRIPIQLLKRHRRSDDILAERFPGLVVMNLRVASNRETGMLPAKQLFHESVVEKLMPGEKLHYFASPEFD
jgi:hypothetical protein